MFFLSRADPLDFIRSHVSPADSQPDATKSTTPEDAPAQDSLKSTEASNKDAFASNQSVSAMTPPNVDSVTSTDALADKKPVESREEGDTEMVDAPNETAKPPSPPADPVASTADSAPEKTAETGDTAEPPAEPAQSPAAAAEAAETLVKAEPAVKVKSPTDGDQKKSDAPVAGPGKGVEGGDVNATASSEAQPAPGDLVTPTTSMSQMALDASQESAAAPLTVDTSMTDTPSQPSAKVAREREEDEEDEPMAKRARTSGEQAAESAQPKPEPTVVPDAMAVDVPAPAPAPASVPAPEAQPMPDGSSVPPSDPGFLNDRSLDANPITAYQNKQIRKALGLVKKTKDGQHFRQSVQTLWPSVWDQYRQLIAHPMDISLIESNLRSGHYSTLGQFRRDVELLQENATTFNGANHDVTSWAKNTVGQIFWRLSQIPSEEPAKPAKQEPKQMPTRHPEPRNPPPPKPKKEPRPAASSPADKTSEAQIYALLPSGLPNIRRDSTKNDSDRPKRPIHPPKNKDIGFQPKTTKKKPELKFCEEVMKEVKAPKHWQNNQWFMEPVDPVALNIPTYHSIVKQPMDLGTMNDKLQRGEYETAKDFKVDFNLIVKNCVKFNGEDHAVTNAAKELEKIFDKKWSEKASWLSKHAQSLAPPASATSPRGGARDDSDDEDASEAEPEQQDSTAADIVEVQRAIEALTTRLKKEQSEVDKKLFSANPDMSDIDTHRGIITHLQNQMVEKRQLLNKLETKKGPQPKATKKKAPGGGGASGSSVTKKVSGGAGATKKSAGASAPVKKPSKKKLNDEEKEIVSEAIARLESSALDKAIAIIKKDTGLKVSASSIYGNFASSLLTDWED